MIKLCAIKFPLNFSEIDQSLKQSLSNNYLSLPYFINNFKIGLPLFLTSL